MPAASLPRRAPPSVQPVPWSASHGVHLDTATGLYWCALCTFAAASARGFDKVSLVTKTLNVESNEFGSETANQSVIVGLGASHGLVEAHLACAEHVSNLEVHILHVHEFLPVAINGVPMLLDHHCVFPSAMFGSGRVVYDVSLGMVLSADVCGAVRLFPHHHYRVIQLMIPDDGVRHVNRRYYRRRNAWMWLDQQPRRLRQDANVSLPMGNTTRRLVRFQCYAEFEGRERLRRIRKRLQEVKLRRQRRHERRNAEQDGPTPAV